MDLDDTANLTTVDVILRTDNLLNRTFLRIYQNLQVTTYGKFLLQLQTQLITLEIVYLFT